MTDPAPAYAADPQLHQVAGDHYRRHPIQPWDIIRVHGLDFWEGNVIKYVLRRKPGTPRAEDLRKARHYLDYLIAREETHGAAELRARQTIDGDRARGPA